jgi:isoleucyl-tRNA synthetase
LTSEEKELVVRELHPIPSKLGKKHGRLFPRLKEALSRLDADSAAQAFGKGLSLDVDVDGRMITVLPDEVEVRTRAREGYEAEHDEGIVVGLSVAITDELAMEGLARDIVRRIQNQRKEAGFEIADQIITYYDAGKKLCEVFEIYGEYIAEETLSTTLYRSTPPRDAFVKTFELGGETLKIGLIRVGSTR